MRATSSADPGCGVSISPTRARRTTGATRDMPRNGSVAFGRRSRGWTSPNQPSRGSARRPRLEHPILLVEPSTTITLAQRCSGLFGLRISVRATYNAAMADATAAAGGNDTPTSLLTSLHGLFDRLRAAGVPVSMVEVVDAVESLRHIDAANRRQFRSALAATLVKRPEDFATFDQLFDVQFPLRREPPVSQPGPTVAPEEGPGNGQAVPAAPSGDLLEALLDALRNDDEGALRALAGLAVDQHGGMETQRHGSERYYMYRIMRQLELYRLLQAVTGAEPGAEALDREQLKAGIDDFRRLIAEQIRHRLSAVRGAEEAAELYRDRQLDDLDFLDANASQLRELRQAIRPLARKLAARMAKRRRRRRRGRLDVRRTLRHSLA